MKPPTFRQLVAGLKSRFDELSSRRLVLFGGKGGVGKTTVSTLAALHFSKTRPAILFSTDPASNLRDLFGDEKVRNLRIEELDAAKLYQTFLDENLLSLLELGDRGTYLDREELQRFFELPIPGINELMAWLRIGELVEAHEDSIVVVDTAPTGHTLRMLSSSAHFQQFSEALEAMQLKHRELIEQFSRRRVRDALDEFIQKFSGKAEHLRALLADQSRSVFIPVMLAEPLVIEQSVRLIRQIAEVGLHVPFGILNQRSHGHDKCDICQQRYLSEQAAVKEVQTEIVSAPRACVPIDTIPRLRKYLDGVLPSETVGGELRSSKPLQLTGASRLLFFAGKGGVGKTSTATSVALQYAAASPGEQFTILSVDPAHSLADLFENQKPPANLHVETIDTKAKWNRLREKIGDEIARAIDAFTPKGMTLAHDTEVIRRLLEIAPPGADEIFAVMRLSDLLDDDSQKKVFVDTAPTGHFLRLLELPATAGEWVREFMRLLLKYRDLIPPGSLAEELLRASRALHAFEAALSSPKVEVIMVMRPDSMVVRETGRLAGELEKRGIRIGGRIANYLTPESSCSCEESRRSAELEQLARGGEGVTLLERRSAPPESLEDLRKLVPLVQTGKRDV